MNTRKCWMFAVLALVGIGSSPMIAQQPSEDFEVVALRHLAAKLRGGVVALDTAASPANPIESISHTRRAMWAKVLGARPDGKANVVHCPQGPDSCSMTPGTVLIQVKPAYLRDGKYVVVINRIDPAPRQGSKEFSGATSSTGYMVFIELVDNQPRVTKVVTIVS